MRRVRMQSAIMAEVKFDTPTKRARPEVTTSSSARHAHLERCAGVRPVDQKDVHQSVRSRFRLASTSPRMLARLESRSGPS